VVVVQRQVTRSVCGDGYEWCRAEEEHWRGLRMAASSSLSDAKAVVLKPQ
jgi:hypothetical protein